MTYRVEITSDAEADLDGCYAYIARASPLNALRWWRRFYELAERLALQPEACTLAPESDAIPFVVRQQLYGAYRILFTIDGERVVILRIRHAARLALPPDEINPPPS